MGGGGAMPRFFVEKDAVRDGRTVVISGEDAKHISLSLRSKPGECFTVCDGEGMEYNCVVSEITKNEVFLDVMSVSESKAEPTVKVTLYQALTKSDKFESIIQKSVELGVEKIVPVLTERCISRPDGNSMTKKLERWGKIAKEAAMQSGRAILPEVSPLITFDKALEEMKKDDCFFVCYEDFSHTPMTKVVNEAKSKSPVQTLSFAVGPEGGISQREAQLCRDGHIPLAGLGPRILRTETAPLCVLSGVMLMTGNLD